MLLLLILLLSLGSYYCHNNFPLIFTLKHCLLLNGIKYTTLFYLLYHCSCHHQIIYMQKLKNQIVLDYSFWHTDKTWTYYSVKEVLRQPLQTSIDYKGLSHDPATTTSHDLVLFAIDCKVKPGNNILEPIAILQLLCTASLFSYQLDNTIFALCLSHSFPTYTACNKYLSRTAITTCCNRWNLPFHHQCVINVNTCHYCHKQPRYIS